MWFKGLINKSFFTLTNALSPCDGIFGFELGVWGDSLEAAFLGFLGMDTSMY